MFKRYSATLMKLNQMKGMSPGFVIPAKAGIQCFMEVATYPGFPFPRE